MWVRWPRSGDGGKDTKYKQPGLENPRLGGRLCGHDGVWLAHQVGRSIKDEATVTHIGYSCHGCAGGQTQVAGGPGVR